MVEAYFNYFHWFFLLKYDSPGDTKSTDNPCLLNYLNPNSTAQNYEFEKLCDI